jgi:2-polyprenyl-3-methyl-5-hydroxy-6-metoxy-1,4-benzoquinol methylase
MRPSGHAYRRRIAQVERYVIQGGSAGRARLELLARARRASTVDLLHVAGLREGMRCLDLGCGAGAVTHEIADLIGETGSVVGVDVDDEIIAIARDAAREQGLSNVEFRTANVNEWDEPSSYDFVYSRFLLQHLSRPVDLLRRMWRAVRPGGALAVEDADFDGLFCEPGNDGFEFYKTMYMRALTENGGDPVAGRRLLRHFLNAGIGGGELRMSQTASSTGEAKRLSVATLAATAHSIVDAGLATEAEVTAAIGDLALFTDDSGTVIGDPRTFQVYARR